MTPLLPNDNQPFWPPTSWKSAMKFQTKVIKKQSRTYIATALFFAFVMPSSYNKVRTSCNINQGIEAYVIQMDPLTFRFPLSQRQLCAASKKESELLSRSLHSSLHSGQTSLVSSLPSLDAASETFSTQQYR